MHRSQTHNPLSPTTHLYHDVSHERLWAGGRHVGQVGGPFELHQGGAVESAAQGTAGDQVLPEAALRQAGQLTVLGGGGLAERLPVLQRDVVHSVQQQTDLVGERC